MAQVVQDPQLQNRIEGYLAYLFSEWEDLPSLAAEWDQCDDYERLDFVVEWPIREDRLRQLRHWSEQGLLTPSQQARYHKLLELVSEHRPLLERLLRD